MAVALSPEEETTSSESSDMPPGVSQRELDELQREKSEVKAIMGKVKALTSEIKSSRRRVCCYKSHSRRVDHLHLPPSISPAILLPQTHTRARAYLTHLLAFLPWTVL